MKTKEEINLNFLSENKTDKKIPVLLTIHPYSALSMNKTICGGYYSTILFPDKNMLCGLFENLLGYHFSYDIRFEIYKKLYNTKIKPKFKNTYIPLLNDFFDINFNIKSKYILFDDLWSRCYSRLDSATHINGTKHHGDIIELSENDETVHSKLELLNNIKKYNNELNETKNKKKQCKNKDDKNLLDNKIKELKKILDEYQKKLNELEKVISNKLFNLNKDKYPYYYNTPTKRQYVLYEDKIEIKLNMCEILYNKLYTKLNIKNDVYLGTSEGLVFLELNKI